MSRTVVLGDTLFIVRDVFGRLIKTTKNYWRKIKEEKHLELTAKPKDVIDALEHPDEVYRSVQDPYVAIYYKRFDGQHLAVVVKFVDEEGFVITCYLTTKTKRKGEKLWP